MRNLSGQVVGKLTIIERAFKAKNSNNYYWKCLCDCGKEVFVIDNHFLNNHTKSCGCLKKRKKIAKYQAAKNRILRTYKRHALSRKLEFFLTDEEFFNLLERNCFYCNDEPKGILVESGDVFRYNGIDRKDNRLGYTKDNCSTCCKVCNMMKKVMKEEEFISHCVKISKFRGN